MRGGRPLGRLAVDERRRLPAALGLAVDDERGQGRAELAREPLLLGGERAQLARGGRLARRARRLELARDAVELERELLLRRELGHRRAELALELRVGLGRRGGAERGHLLEQPLGLALRARVLLGEELLRARRELVRLAHRLALLGVDDQRLEAEAAQRPPEVRVAPRGHRGGGGDPEAVRVQHGEHQALAEVVDGVVVHDRRRERALLGLLVADLGEDHRVRVGEPRAGRDAERVAELAALGDRRHAREGVAGERAVRLAEVADQVLQPLRVPRVAARVDLGQAAVEEVEREDRGGPVPRPGHDVSLLDAARLERARHRLLRERRLEAEPGAADRGRGADVPDHLLLDVLGLELPSRITIEIGHRHREPVARILGAPDRLDRAPERWVAEELTARALGGLPPRRARLGLAAGQRGGGQSDEESEGEARRDQGQGMASHGPAFLQPSCQPSALRSLIKSRRALAAAPGVVAAVAATAHSTPHSGPRRCAAGRTATESGRWRGSDRPVARQRPLA